MLATLDGAKARGPVACVDEGWLLRRRRVEHENLLADLLLRGAAIRDLLEDSTVRLFLLHCLIIWCTHDLLGLLLQRICG